jgi:hypothetical protein
MHADTIVIDAGMVRSGIAFGRAVWIFMRLRGVTLAAVESSALAAAVASGALRAEFSPFHPGHFDVSQAG